MTSSHLAPITHPRTLGWVGTTALAIGGSNQSLFLLAALFIGQGDILGQGSAAIPLLMVGLLLSYLAAPGWTELVLMFPNRVGGIAATCAEAFRPYSPVLANLTGVCYWWGWVPTCGLTALLSASAIHQWYLPNLSITLLAVLLVMLFMLVNFAGVKWVARLVMPIAFISSTLAFLSGLLPMLNGQVDWHQATTFHLTTPFDGWFGQLTSLMAGLYLIGFAAPAFEAATCHVGETKDPAKQVPRAMLASALMAAVYFVVLPLVWMGTLGSEALSKDLALELGPTFAPLFGSAAKAAAIWFMMFNMFHGSIQPLAGASRTLSQLSEDGLLPKVLALRNKNDTPWVATLLTAVMSILFLLLGDPVWLIAAANFTYLIGICLPSVAVWLLRRDQPQMARPYRAPRGLIGFGLLAAAVWGFSAALGFQQFGLQTILLGLGFAYSGTVLYALRKYQDRREQGMSGITGSLHIKLTGAMVAVLLLDGAGYLLAVSNVPHTQTPLIAALEDIFVAVAMLTISVGLILPGMIAHSAVQVSNAARRLASGTILDFSRAMIALGEGKIEHAHARIDRVPVLVNSNDELGEMASSFNILQSEIAIAASGLDAAREGLIQSRARLKEHQAQLERVAHYDVLTNLPNRALLAERLSQAIAQRRKQSLAVLFLDLDGFKEINDTHGHDVGDELLIELSQRMKEALRDGDTLARIGGDEFIAILVDLEQTNDCDAVLRRLLNAAASPVNFGGITIQISTSIGITLYPQDGGDADQLVRHADQAMYVAKQAGKNRYHWFDVANDEAVKIQRESVGQIHTALDNQEFVLYYQPKVNMKTGKVIGAEALIRWLHPERGVVLPGSFLPVIESHQLSIAIGDWVIDTALAQISQWQAIGLNIPVSVNVGALQLQQANFVTRLAEHLAAHPQVNPEALEFEILETSALEDIAQISEVMHACRVFGVRFALDDFGTGYSSLTYLKRLPAHILKIDQSFVRDMTNDPDDLAIVKGVIGLAKAFHREVIAEGVETIAHGALLVSLGCELAQGYGIARPMPAQDIPAWTASWRPDASWAVSTD